MANFVNVIISGNSKPLRSAIEKATLSMTGFQKKMALGFVAAGAASAAFATHAIKAAAKEQVAMTELERQIRASTGATAEQIHEQEKYLKAAARSGAFTKSALIPGYESLIVATRDATEAQRILTIGLDVARARHIDIGTVLEALAKGYAGNTRALRQLSPEMKKLIADGATFDEVLSRLNENFGGAASEYAQTFQGRIDILNNSVAALKKQIGLALLPAVEKLVPVLQALVDTLAQHPTMVKAIAIAIGAMAAAFAIATTAVIAYTVATKAAAIANAAMASSQLAVLASSGAGIPVAIAAAAAITLLAGKVYDAVRANYDHAKSIQDATATMGNEERMAAYVHRQQITRAGDLARAQKDSAATIAAAVKAAKERTLELAKANKDRLADALKTARQRVLDLKQAAADLAASIHDQVFGMVSLNEAVSTATSTEEDYQAALKERRDAYAELARLQEIVYDVATGKTAVANAEDLAAAMQRVADAETAVTAAQGKRVDYVSQFQAQIAAAKEFAGNLQSLIAQGLTQTGLQQLINLGPVAGNTVAKSILAGGQGALSVSDLNLTNLEAAALGLGGAVSGQVYGAQIAGAQATAGQVQQAQTINITVTSADPDKVVEALVKWAKKNGKLPNPIKAST